MTLAEETFQSQGSLQNQGAAVTQIHLLAHEVGDQALELDAVLALQSILLELDITEHLVSDLTYSLELARALNDPRIANILISLASAEIAAGEATAGLEHARSGFEIYHDAGDETGTGWARYFEGTALSLLQRQDDARTVLREAHALLATADPEHAHLPAEALADLDDQNS